MSKDSASKVCNKLRLTASFQGDLLYDSAQHWPGGAGLGLWETPGPLGKNRPSGLIPNDDERLHENIKKHEVEMETLIKNISARIQVGETPS